MKNKVIISLILLITVFTIHSEEIIIFVANGYTYNNIYGGLTDTTFAIKYNTETSDYLFLSKDFLTTGFVYLDEDGIEQLRKNIDKYIEWEIIAIEKQVKIDKVLPDSAITRKVGFWYGDEWYVANNLTMLFTFFSQTENRHQLVISSNKVDSTSNNFIDYQIETIYLDKDQIIALSDGISTDSITSAINEYNKQQETEDMFK